MKRYRELILVLIALAAVTVGVHFVMRAYAAASPATGWLFTLGTCTILGLSYLAIRFSSNWAGAVYFGGFGLTVLGLTYMLAFTTSTRPMWPLGFLGLGAAVLIPAFIEHIVLRIAENHPLGAITRVTYYEALLQPFTLIIMGLALAAIFFAAYVPFYTLSEDHKMYRDVASSFVSLAALLVMVYSSAKVIDEEIENRTMLTLMSKPIARWQVVVGKYLGVVLVSAVVIGVLAVAVGLFSYLRYFEDLRIDFNVAGSLAERQALFWANQKAMLAFVPLFVLQFLMIATLAAVAVAISTRYSLALNMTVIAVVYVGANMTRFVDDLHLAQPWQGMASYGSYLLPFLANFDLSQRLLYGDPPFLVGSEAFVKGIPSYGQIWGYIGLTGVYAALYIGAALSVATALFRTRELT